MIDYLKLEEKLIKQDKDEFEQSQLQKQADFFDLHCLVRDEMGWDDEKTKNWFYTENPMIGNFTPLDYYGRRPEKCIKWITSLLEENQL
jgi:hypothetical protein